MSNQLSLFDQIESPAVEGQLTNNEELDEEAIATLAEQAANYLREISNVMFSRELPSEVKRQKTSELHQLRQEILVKIDR